jgi:hypothetical protein
LKQAEENEQHCREMVLMELRDGEVGECEVGRVTYKAQQRKAYMVAAQTIRVLRFTPRKGA